MGGITMLDKLKGRFWAREEELVADVEAETGYEVAEIVYDYMILVDNEEEEIEVELVRAGSTITMK